MACVIKQTGIDAFSYCSIDVKMDKTSDRSDNEGGVILGARHGGSSISGMAGLLGFSRVYREGCDKQTSSQRQSCGQKQENVKNRASGPQTRSSGHIITNTGQLRSGKILPGPMNVGSCCVMLMAESGFGVSSISPWPHPALCQRYSLVAMM